MDIMEIIRDIFTDAEIAQQKSDASRPFRKRRGAGWVIICLPQLIGFAVGAVAALFLSLGGAGTLILGALCALTVGTINSVTKDQISLAPAIVRNIIIMLMLSAIVGLCMLIDRARNKR